MSDSSSSSSSSDSSSSNRGGRSDGRVAPPASHGPDGRHNPSRIESAGAQSGLPDETARRGAPWPPRQKSVSRIGIRREDKSVWEARVPLVPDDVAHLVLGDTTAADIPGIPIAVQRSDIRAFDDAAYAEAGATLPDTLDDCPIVMGVKEIPLDQISAGRTYVCFAHVIKGQRENMPALAKYIDHGCTLIDYEKITDDEGRRLVFFGRYAGIAGMIDTLWALGKRLEAEGVTPNPFLAVRPAHEYEDAATAGAALRTIGESIERDGLPACINPLVVGFAGYGQVSKGAQSMFDHLYFRTVDPDHLAEEVQKAEADVARDGRPVVLKTIFQEQHMVQPKEPGHPFELQEYYRHPDRYESTFFPHAKLLSVLVTAIYWEPKYPRLITQEQFRSLYSDPAQPPRLRIVGDITCDIDGAVACTRRSTTPDNPVYVYDPATGDTQDGVRGFGPVVLAVDFLPCEVPVDASRAFSQAIRPFVPGLATANLSTAESLEEAGLPPELERATIVFRGKLTPKFRYLTDHLPAAIATDAEPRTVAGAGSS